VNNESYVKRLIFMFGLVYFAQGLAQSSGLLSQPLSFYMKEVLHFDEAQSTSYLAVLTLPWLIKPVYGLVSDFIPLFGYRRKTWLLALNVMAAGAFFWLTGLTEPSRIVFALLLTAFGTAASDVIVDALMVENGKKFNMVGKFQSVQWFWFYAAQIATSLAGGWLASMSDPGTGLHVAAMITMLAPATVAIATWLIVKEEKAKINLEQLKTTTAGLKQAFTSRTLWAAVLFLAFWNFSPSFGTPMYYHMTDTLKFSQTFIGQLGALGSIGALAGAWIYGKWFTKRTLNYQLVFSITAGTIGTFAYLSVVTLTPYSSYLMAALSVVFGCAGAIASLATLTLAGRSVPANAEGFTFAALMSVHNGFAQLSAIVGSWMFVHWFDRNLTPLIMVSGVFTLACFALLPTLKGVRGQGLEGSKQ
jgi:MFS family permease